MSTRNPSRQALRGEPDALARLIHGLADDLYECRSADLQRTRAEIERTLQEVPSENTHRRRELKALWELTHAFLSKVPRALESCLELGSDSVESAILDLIESDEALELEEICEFSGLEQDSVQKALKRLERLGLLAPLVGDARRLTRDGREVKRWIAGRKAAGKPATRASYEATLPAPARSKQKARPPAAVSSIEASRRLISSFDQNLRTTLRLATSGARRTLAEAQALRQEAAHKRSLLRMAGSDLQVLRRKEVRELEAKVPPGTEIWVIGVTPPNGAAFFDAVASNIARSGIRYFYVCPESDFRDLWTRLARTCSEDHLRSRLTCIMNAPELLRLDTARIHVLPNQRIRSLRVCWLGLEKPQPSYLAGSIPADLPYGEILGSYRLAASRLIANDPGGWPVMDFQRLEGVVRSIGRVERTPPS